jgi:hypothetical protein
MNDGICDFGFAICDLTAAAGRNPMNDLMEHPSFSFTKGGLPQRHGGAEKKGDGCFPPSPCLRASVANSIPIANRKSKIQND